MKSSKMTMRMAPAALLVTAAMGAMTGCNFAPKYERPKTPAPPAYKENQPGNAIAQSEGWRQADPKDAQLRGKWWEIFHDEELNALEEKVVVDNQTVAQSMASYEAALAQVATAEASLYPTVTIGASGTRRRTPVMTSTVQAKSVATTSNTLQMPLSISWAPDLFGKVRNQIHANTEAAQLSAADLENVKLTQQSSLAQYYFQLRGQDALQQVYDQSIAAYREALKLTESLFKLGMKSQVDVAQAETTLRTAEANAVQVSISRAQYEHAIALLIGQPAGNFSLPAKAIAAKPPTVPTGIPSAILERRPDIASAERKVQQQNSLIGVGKAAYYPTITLTAGGGTQSSPWSNLLNWDNRYWSLGPTISETVFDGGARKATMALYKANHQAAVANYKQIVLNAFKEVEDYLVSNRQLAEQVGREKMAVDASGRYTKVAQVRYDTGVDTYLNVITAETALLNNQLALARLQTQQMTSAVQLIAALGGGWDASQLPTEKQIRDTKIDAKVDEKK